MGNMDSSFLENWPRFVIWTLWPVFETLAFICWGKCGCAISKNNYNERAAAISVYDNKAYEDLKYRSNISIALEIIKNADVYFSEEFVICEAGGIYRFEIIVDNGPLDLKPNFARLTNKSLEY